VAQELGQLGLLPLMSGGSATLHKSKTYDRRDATANAAIAARLPCLMTTSRFAHAVMVMARALVETLGVNPRAIENRLQRWIAGYAGQDPQSLLYSARIEIQRLQPAQGGGYAAVLHLRPRLERDELTSELRVVTRLPWLEG